MVVLVNVWPREPTNVETTTPFCSTLPLTLKLAMTAFPDCVKLNWFTLQFGNVKHGGTTLKSVMEARGEGGWLMKKIRARGLRGSPRRRARRAPAAAPRKSSSRSCSTRPAPAGSTRGSSSDPALSSRRRTPRGRRAYPRSGLGRRDEGARALVRHRRGRRAQPDPRAAGHSPQR